MRKLQVVSSMELNCRQFVNDWIVGVMFGGCSQLSLKSELFLAPFLFSR